MNADDRHRRLGELFARARELHEEEREAFLARECGDDTALYRDVIALLHHDRDSGGPIPPLDSDAPRGASTELLKRLSSHRPKEPRYKIVGEIARGGMGAILRVKDEDLGRFLAMKVTLGQADPESKGDTPPVDPRTLGRFLEEAQITGQLDHPGIVPVHELGLDDEGRVFFTMRLVKGDEFRYVIRLARKGEQGWNRTRALGVLHKACEAMAFAHDRKVIHRDLKPSNLMVGRFGETYVMDWGLGRVLDEPDTKDIRLRGPGETTVAGVHTDRRDDSGDIDAPLLTMDGDVVGTPAYMSPEQAGGQLDLMGRHSDVYSLGAILYELLTGRAPYQPTPGARVSAHTILRWVLEGPPLPIESFDTSVPPELVAICDQAMSRDIARRYPTVQELADDLRAYLENRVVKAHRTGAVVEFTKWVSRNRAVAMSLGALIVVGFAAAAIITMQERSRRRTVERSLREELAHTSLAALDELWPFHPDMIVSMEQWLGVARKLVQQLPLARAELQAFQLEQREAEHEPDPAAEAEPPVGALLKMMRVRREAYESDLVRRTEELASLRDRAGADEQRIAWLRHEVAVYQIEIPFLASAIVQAEASLARHRDWRLGDAELEQRHARLRDYVENLERFIGEDGAIATVEARLALNRERWTASLADQQLAWRGAIASIANPQECPRYSGLEITAQHGLVPLGQDADSGLWEFWHYLSGDRPAQRGDGGWVIDPVTGIVLVLLPGATFSMGVQSEDPDGPNFVDLNATEYIERLRPSEQPVHAVTIDPFFISKYELTQSQWLRLTGEAPSLHYAGASYLGDALRISRTHPVEHVSWNDCDEALLRWGLEIPTEAQWELSARAGTQGPYWTGSSFEALVGSVNFADEAIERRGVIRSIEVAVDDGHSVHAPVDAFRPNPNGLYNISGNVAEWCRDWTNRSGYHPDADIVANSTGEHTPSFGVTKAIRGGSFLSNPADLRLSRRYMRLPLVRDEGIGVRASRRVDQ